MTYPEAIRFLYDLRWHGAKLGLEHTAKLAALTGNPHHRLRFIHVAGTNGKGSTCAMLEGIYRAAGLRVGLFTSPHLVSFGERIQVNRQPIGEEAVTALVSELQPLLEQFPKDPHPTFFEVVTIMALLHFERNRCDIVIWETGLGGRLDSTNIVTPLVSVITNIQYDHQKWLGESLPSIASEKAGIIKPGIPVVTGTDAPDALEVIRNTALKLNASLTLVRRQDTKAPPLDTIKLPLLGAHQEMNAAVALAAARAAGAAKKGIAGAADTPDGPESLPPIPDTAIVSGLSSVQWAGRLQLVRRSSAQEILLDGAHNVGGAQALADALNQYFRGDKPALILGILQDKDWSEMCRILAPLARRILLVPVHSERSADPHALAEACRHVDPETRVAEFASLSSALAAVGDEDFVTIAGSLYLVGEAMELLELLPGAEDERELNEWGLGAGTGGR